MAVTFLERNGYCNVVKIDPDDIANVSCTDLDRGIHRYVLTIHHKMVQPEIYHFANAIDRDRFYNSIKEVLIPYKYDPMERAIRDTRFAMEKIHIFMKKIDRKLAEKKKVEKQKKKDVKND